MAREPTKRLGNQVWGAVQEAILQERAAKVDGFILFAEAERLGVQVGQVRDRWRAGRSKGQLLWGTLQRTVQAREEEAMPPGETLRV